MKKHWDYRRNKIDSKTQKLIDKGYLIWRTWDNRSIAHKLLIPSSDGLKKLISQNLNQFQIGEILGKNHRTISRWIKTYNLKYVIKKSKSKTTKEELIGLVAEGLDQGEIAERAGTSDTTVSRLIKQYKIPYKRKITNKNIKTQFKPKGKTDFEKFEKDLKSKFGKADVYIVCVMKDGKLIPGKIADEWWEKKKEVAFERKGVYPG